MIDEALDADQAMKKVGASLPNLIFMDIKLPNGNGLALTQKIKKEHPEINIIILTSYDFLEYRLAATQYGANHFLSKASVTIEEIRALVKSFLEKRTPDPSPPFSLWKPVLSPGQEWLTLKYYEDPISA